MSKPNLTAERLRELFHYDPETGVFTRLVRTAQRANIGDIAGSKNSDGYVQIMITRGSHKAHRLAWLYVYGVWPVGQIDHINGQRTDNRIENLREVSHAGNMQNQRIAQTHNRSTGLLGVRRRGEVFNAQIKIDNKSCWLGTFKTAEAAQQAYLNAKRRFHPACTI